MRSFQHKPDNRRETYLALVGSIESQLRDAYAKRHEAGLDTQASVAQKLGINRSAIHNRLMGQTNMTTKTIADMVWALGHSITVKIFDPLEEKTNDTVVVSDLSGNNRVNSYNSNVQMLTAPQVQNIQQNTLSMNNEFTRILGIGGLISS